MLSDGCKVTYKDKKGKPLLGEKKSAQSFPEQKCPHQECSGTVRQFIKKNCSGKLWICGDCEEARRNKFFNDVKLSSQRQLKMKQKSIIFINYRRDDTSGYARVIHDKLIEKINSFDSAFDASFHVGVFMDVETISAGINFEDFIKHSLNSSLVVIVLIGKDWLSTKKDRGKRLDDPADYVRMEIITALNKGIPILPILLQGSKMPAAEDLPLPLAPLSKINALEIRDSNFESDLQEVVGTIFSKLFDDEHFLKKYFTDLFGSVDKKVNNQMLFSFCIGGVFGGLLWILDFCSDAYNCIFWYGTAGLFLFGPSSILSTPSGITGAIFGFIAAAMMAYDSYIFNSILHREIIQQGVIGSVVGGLIGLTIDSLYYRIKKKD